MTNTFKPTVAEALEVMKDKELGQIKVFLVEDDQMISDLVTAKLSLSGCIPYTTANGAEAIEMAELYTPDIIILDLMLPGMTGEEILTALKSLEDLKDIPVVIFSNKSEEDIKEKVMKLGAAAYYVKAATDLNIFIAELKGLVKK
jgi:two-component system phosphate regulon response regulator PhoB